MKLQNSLLSLLFTLPTLCPGVGFAFGSSHGYLEGYVRDSQGRPVRAAYVNFTAVGTDSRLGSPNDLGTDETARNGRYRLKLRPGDYEGRAKFGPYYGQVVRVHVSERAKVVQDFVLSKIEPIVWGRSQAHADDVCAAANVVNKTWSEFSEELNRMSEKPVPLANYQEKVGDEFMPSYLVYLGRGIGPTLELERFSCARRWYNSACQKGSTSACSKLPGLDERQSTIYHNESFKYRHGVGVPDNYQLALEWARKGAELDYIQSMYDLGKYYREGRIVEKDSLEAFKWLKTASDLGCKPAMTDLADMYASGEGVGRDEFQAALWDALSGRPAELYRRSLSRSEVARVQKLATEWKLGEGKGRCQ